MTTSRKWAAVRIVLTAAYLFIGWLLFTWSIAPDSLISGGAFSLIIAAATYRLFIDEGEAARRTLLPRLHMLLLYLLYLIYALYSASFRTAVAVLKNDYSPRVVHFRTRLQSDIARSVIAGSITLTPGTITLELTDDHLVVHWLEAQTTHSRYAGELVKGRLEKLLKRVWT
jgi:multicomponent Na+:H+ antiporter subunit E